MSTLAHIQRIQSARPAACSPDTPHALPLVAIVASLALAGCGPAAIGAALSGGSSGGGGGSSGPPPPPPEPTLTAVVPDSGFADGAPGVRLLGTGFQANAAGQNVVTFGGTPAPSVTVLSDTSLKVSAPGGAPGAKDIVVQNENGTDELAGGFTCFAWPSVFTDGDQRIDHAPGAAPSNRPQMVSAGQCIYIVWEDHRNGNTDVYFNRSLDGGITWQDQDIRI